MNSIKFLQFVMGLLVIFLCGMLFQFHLHELTGWNWFVELTGNWRLIVVLPIISIVYGWCLWHSTTRKEIK